jgi:hypothetical protein
MDKVDKVNDAGKTKAKRLPRDMGSLPGLGPKKK